MRYLSAPFKTLQLSHLALDLGFAATVVLALDRHYPYPNRWIHTLAWPVAVALCVFVVGGYDLRGAVIRRRFGPWLLAAVAAAALLAYPFLSGPDRPRLRYSVACTALTAICLWGERRLRRQAAEQTREPAVFLLTSEAARRRLDSARREIEEHFVIVAVERPDTANPEQLAASHGADATIVAAEFGPDLTDAMVERLLESQLRGIRVIDFVDLYASATGRIPLDLVDRRWLLRHALTRRGSLQTARLRRLFGAVVGIALVLLALPLMLLIAIVVWIDSGRPVLFRQERLGQYRKPFQIYKFRTMQVNAEAGGPRWASQDDPRVTRVGRLLRRTHLDELPQLFNVLKGELELIGPRPIRKHFADQLAQQTPHYDMRFLHPPGVTGWTQVIGPYGVDTDEQLVKLEMDLYYLKNAGLVDDLYILLRTARAVLQGSGT